MLPKFLMADNYDITDREYIVHTKYPRCIIQFSVEDLYEDQEIYWIDDEIDDDDEFSKFMEEVEDYYNAELDALEEDFEEVDIEKEKK